MRFLDFYLNHNVFFKFYWNDLFLKTLQVHVDQRWQQEVERRHSLSCSEGSSRFPLYSHCGQMWPSSVWKTCKKTKDSVMCVSDDHVTNSIKELLFHTNLRSGWGSEKQTRRNPGYRWQSCWKKIKQHRLLIIWIYSRFTDYRFL